MATLPDRSDLVPRESMAQRFLVMMRRAGRTRSLLASGEVLIETADETSEEVRESIRACVAILRVTTSIIETPGAFRVTLLRIA